MMTKQYFSPNMSTCLKKIEKELVAKLSSDIVIEHALVLGKPEQHSLLQNLQHKHGHILCEHYSTEPTQPTHTCLGKFTDLPYAPESIDLIILAHNLESASDPKAIIEEAAECLSPRGTLIIFLRRPCATNITPLLTSTGLTLTKKRHFFSIIRHLTEHRWTNLCDRMLALYLPFLCYNTYLVAKKITLCKTKHCLQADTAPVFSFGINTQCAARTRNTS